MCADKVAVPLGAIGWGEYMEPNSDEGSAGLRYSAWRAARRALKRAFISSPVIGFTRPLF